LRGLHTKAQFGSVAFVAHERMVSYHERNGLHRCAATFPTFAEEAAEVFAQQLRVGHERAIIADADGPLINEGAAGHEVGRTPRNRSLLGILCYAEKS